jgi:hypothetical protein
VTVKKVKTKGRKWTVKKANLGPRYCVACHKASTSMAKAKEVLCENFDVSDSLAEVVLRSAPVVILRDLSQDEATEYVTKMKRAGDFRVWLESASTRLKQMNLRPRMEDM